MSSRLYKPCPRLKDTPWRDWEVAAAVKWYFCDGVAVEEIAAILGRSPGGVLRKLAAIKADRPELKMFPEIEA